MKKLFFLFLVLFACDFKHTKPISHIDTSKVEKVLISANPKLMELNEGDTIRMVSQSDFKDFFSVINTSFNAGEIKFMPRYRLRVIYKDGFVRNFTLSGNIIKENGDDVAQEMRVINYADTIWALSK